MLTKNQNKLEKKSTESFSGPPDCKKKQEILSSLSDVGTSFVKGQYISKANIKFSNTPKNNKILNIFCPSL
jgi:hypothetical protein